MVNNWLTDYIKIIILIFKTIYKNTILYKSIKSEKRKDKINFLINNLGITKLYSMK